MSGFFKEIPPYYEHQKATTDFISQNPVVFDASDPGTGKTRPAIGAFVGRRSSGGGKCLVLAPKSILQAAWGNDVDKFFPGTSYMVAYATNRKQALAMDVDIYITNHDAATWLVGFHEEFTATGKKMKRVRNVPLSYWKDFDTIIVDESTAFKNHNAKRSMALLSLTRHFRYREVMTGTPNPNSVTELWNQVRILDGGERLGTAFWKFRSIVCEPTQVGPNINHIQWKDKPGSEESVFDLIDDIVIRHKYGDCHDDSKFGKPYKVKYYLPLRARRQYNDMVDMAATMLNDGSLLVAGAASAVHQKLMQMASGAVYKDDQSYSVIDTGRYDLILDLIEAREQCVVGFLWRHQRLELEKAAKTRGVSYAIIDGTTKDRERIAAVESFQRGDTRVIFAHPQSGGHGLTLTAGTTTIWASPTYNSEHYIQFGARINRAGQEKETETILVTGHDTIDDRVYDKLGGKLDSMQLLLELLGE